MNIFLFTAINMEKQEVEKIQEIENFQKDQLKHTEPAVKNVLPDKDSKKCHQSRRGVNKSKNSGNISNSQVLPCHKTTCLLIYLDIIIKI